jgi:membrane protein
MHNRVVGIDATAAVLNMIGHILAAYLDEGLGVPRRFAWLWAIAQWPLVFGLRLTALGWVYYFAPNVSRRWAWVTPGSIVATLLWIVASLGFRWYAGHFGEYQRTYGAIGGVIVALLWLYVSGLAVLIGAELNAAIEHPAPDLQDPGGPSGIQHATASRRSTTLRRQPRAPRPPTPVR